MPTDIDRLPDAREMLVIDQAVAEQIGRPGALLGILERVQPANPHKYLSFAGAAIYRRQKRACLRRGCYSAATFFALFNLDPQGENVICVCRGTACHTRNSRDLLEKLCMDLGLAKRTCARAERGGQTVADHAGPQVYDSHRGLFRPVRAGAGGGNQSPHPEPCERAHAAARGESAEAVREVGHAESAPAKPVRGAAGGEPERPEKNSPVAEHAVQHGGK